jgi:uncharacterized protein
MINSKFKLLTTLMLLCCSINIHAIRVSDLYSSKISVQDRSAEVQKKAFITAFNNVVVRTALDRSVLTIPGISKQVEQADKYINKYYYSDNGDQLYLNVEFDEQAIHELLKNNNRFYLTDVRPLVSFWLVMEEDGITKTVESNSNIIAELISTKASSIGMPIVFPMYDIVDQENITTTDILELNFEKALLAAKRYNSDYIVLGKIKKFADEYSSEWHLIDGAAPALSLDNQIEDQLDAVLKQLSAHMLRNYANNQSDKTASTIVLYVNGIDDLEKLSNIETYLSELPYVDKLQVGELHESTVSFNLSISAGNKESLIKAINLNHYLSIEDRSTDLYNEDQLYYRYG